MQKFDTPAPISAVLDIPAGRIQFIAADRADTTVEVLPANPAKSRDVQAAEQTTVAYADGVLRITPPSPRNQLFGPSGSLEVTVQLPAGSRIEARAASCRTPRRRPPRRRRLRRRVPPDQDRRGRERPPHRGRRRRRGRPAGRPRGDQHREGRHPDRRGRARHGRAAAPSPATSRSAPPPASRPPWTPAPATAASATPSRTTAPPNSTSAPRPPAATSPPAASERAEPEPSGRVHRDRDPLGRRRGRGRPPRPAIQVQGLEEVVRHTSRDQEEHMTKNSTSSTSFDMDRHGAGRRHGPGRHRHRRSRYPRGLPQRPVRHPGVLAAGHRRTGDGMAAHHLRRAGPRQKSKRSADYSFEAAVRDVDAVLAARGVDRALVVGWSYGAFVGGALGRPEPGPCRGRGPGRRRVPVRLARRGHGAADPEAVPATGLVHAAAAPDGPDPADDRRTAGGQQHRARQTLPRARAGPRAGRHHRPGAVRGRFGDVLRKPR